MTEESGPVGALTHIGTDVADLDRAEAFYSIVLGVKRDSAWDQYVAFEPLPSGLTVYLQLVPEKNTRPARYIPHADVSGAVRGRRRSVRGIVYEQDGLDELLPLCHPARFSQ